MNRRPDAPDPLSPEERDLAERLLRLGPHDGPSPALDARILAAAHAAVAPTPRAQHKKSRWPTWIGVAASLSLAVGIGWQLRPVDKAPDAASEAAQAPVAAESADAATAAQAADSVASPELPAAAADAAAGSAPDSPQAAPNRPQELVPPPAGALSQSAPSNRADERAARPAEPPAPAPSSARRQEPRYEVPPMPAPMMAPPPPPAPIAAEAVAPADAAPMSVPAPAAAAPAPGEAYRESAKPAPAAAKLRLSDEARARKSAADNAAPSAFGELPHRPQAEAESKREALSSQGYAGEDRSLDRVEVTGSRLGQPQADAVADSQLPAAEWLDRIRGYRDRGETERAREGLREFRRQHPRARVPEDLRPLLK